MTGRQILSKTICLAGRNRPTSLPVLLATSKVRSVLAIDAEWGAGKTTFLNMWSRHLQNQGFPVVAFNAWETDFTGNPMVALITELAEALGEEDSRSLKATANEIAIRILPNLFKPIPILGGAVAGAVEDTINHFREDRVSDYQRVRDDFRQFKANLSKAAETLSEAHDELPISRHHRRARPLSPFVRR